MTEFNFELPEIIDLDTECDYEIEQVKASMINEVNLSFRRQAIEKEKFEKLLKLNFKY